MDSESDSVVSTLDRWFAQLIMWESRVFGKPWRTSLRLTLVLVVAAVVMPCLWRAAMEPEPLSTAAANLHEVAMLLLIGSPLHSAKTTLTEMSFCFLVLHICGYVVVGFAMLLLPGIAAAGVARDRQTGRLDDLVTTSFSSGAIYLAKLVAATLPFVLAGCTVYGLMVPVMFGERLAALSVFRILFEMILQVGVISAISITCSCVCRSGSVARVLAYIAVWIVLPALWFLVRSPTLSHTSERWAAMGPYSITGDRELRGTWTWVQASDYRMAFLLCICLVVSWIGIRRLFPK